MPDSIRIRARMEDDLPHVIMIIDHPMETGLRRDRKTGTRVPAHYIQRVICEHNGKVVLSASWGKGIAEHPYLSFWLLEGKAGDRVRISWIDNMGASDSREVLIG